MPSKPASAAGVIGKLITRWGGRPGKERLAALWARWEEILGPDLATLAHPLGARGKIMLLGVENAIQMQEVQFAMTEILEKANSFLETPYFEEAHCSIFRNGKIPKQENFAASNPRPAKKKAKISRPSGKYLDQMDRDSPVAKCYAAFANKKI